MYRVCAVVRRRWSPGRSGFFEALEFAGVTGALRFACEGCRTGSWMRVDGFRDGAGFSGGAIDALSRFSSILCGTSREVDGSRIVGMVGTGAVTGSCSFFRLKKDMVDKFVRTYVFNQELVANKRS